LQGDERLVALVRADNSAAFAAIVDRYQSRLLGFCRQMLGSTEDAEDVMQEVFVNAYRAMRGDSREINLRPWLYRIARNRCLNHLRKPCAEAQESMDAVPVVEAASTHERVHNREEFRRIVADVNGLPDTQRAALLLREMDAMSYEEIAQAMETTVPSVKSLLVRARISLAEGSQARRLTCSEVRLELAESAEGLRKASGPARRHVRECEQCTDFRDQIREDAKALAALSPIGPLLVLKGLIASKLGLGGGGAGAAGTGGTTAAGAGTAGGAGTIGAGAGTIGAGSAGSAAGGLGLVGSAIGAKAVAGVVTAAIITAGAVEVKRQVAGDPVSPAAPVVGKIVQAESQPVLAPPVREAVVPHKSAASQPSDPVAAPLPPVAPAPAAPAAAPSDPVAAAPPADAGTGSDATIGTAPHSTGDTAVTTVGDPESKPSQPPPGFSDPPSVVITGPSSDPPTEGAPVLAPATS
jgi:RNA polymerase sigma factor (sigma-70 family)